MTTVFKVWYGGTWMGTFPSMKAAELFEQAMHKKWKRSYSQITISRELV